MSDDFFPPPNPAHAAMGAALRADRGDGTRVDGPATQGAESGDELAQTAQRLGCIDIDALRTLADAEGLSGAALRSRVVGALRDRPWLAPEFEARFAAMPDGLNGGAGRGVHPAIETPLSDRMSTAIRRASKLSRRSLFDHELFDD